MRSGAPAAHDVSKVPFCTHADARSAATARFRWIFLSPKETPFHTASNTKLRSVVSISDKPCRSSRPCVGVRRPVGVRPCLGVCCPLRWGMLWSVYVFRRYGIVFDIAASIVQFSFIANDAFIVASLPDMSFCSDIVLSNIFQPENGCYRFIDTDDFR